MDVIEKFLNEVSWKFDKGYPDITNEQDILMLEKLLGFSLLSEKELANMLLTANDYYYNKTHEIGIPEINLIKFVTPKGELDNLTSKGEFINLPASGGFLNLKGNSST